MRRLLCRLGWHWGIEVVHWLGVCDYNPSSVFVYRCKGCGVPTGGLGLRAAQNRH